MKSGALRIRPWERGDFDRLAAAAPGLSERTLWLRFWGAVRRVTGGEARTLPLAG